MIGRRKKIIKSNDENILVDVKRQIRETDRHVRRVLIFLRMCYMDVLAIVVFF